MNSNDDSSDTALVRPRKRVAAEKHLIAMENESHHIGDFQACGS